MEFQLDIPVLGIWFLILNYIALICYSVYRIFNPEEWFEKSEASLPIVFILSIFMLALPIFADRILQEGELIFLIGIVPLILALATLIKKEIVQYGPKFLVSLLLFSFALGQESFHAASIDPNAPGKIVVLFAFGGFMAISLALGIAGIILVRLFPSFASRHINLIQRPSYFALVTLFFSLWMLARHVISASF